MKRITVRIRQGFGFLSAKRLRSKDPRPGGVIKDRTMANNNFRVDRDDEHKMKSPALRQVTASKKQGTSAAARPQKHQAAPRRKRSGMTAVLLLILAVFTGLILLLNNRSRVSQVTAENASLQRQINKLIKENAQRREEISKSLDLDMIRQEALKLGLQAPVEAQIIEVKQSKRDEIVTNLKHANAEGIDSEDMDMAEIFANVEGFFKTLH